MSREQVQSWAEATIGQQPHRSYCVGRSRFGPSCYDCSGFTYMAYRAAGLMIPGDSASVARWGRDNHQVHPVAAAKLCDLIVHDSHGDPYNSFGPRGHIGLFIRMSGGRVISYESAGSGKGVGVYSRPASFWAISVQHPALAGSSPTPAPPKPVEEEMPTRITLEAEGPRIAVANGITARLLGDPSAVDRMKAYRPSFLTDQQVVTVDSVDMDAMLKRGA